MPTPVPIATRLCTQAERTEDVASRAQRHFLALCAQGGAWTPADVEMQRRLQAAAVAEATKTATLASVAQMFGTAGDAVRKWGRLPRNFQGDLPERLPAV